MAFFSAAIVSNDPSNVVVTVPDGAIGGPITVTTPVGTATSARAFDVSS